MEVKTSIFTWRPRKKFNSLHPSAYCEIFKIRNTDLQFRSPWHNLLKNNNKKKKNAGNCKALWISRNRNKIFFPFLNICAKKMSRNEMILVLIRKNQHNYQHKLNLLKVLFATSKQWLWVSKVTNVVSEQKKHDKNFRKYIYVLFGVTMREMAA